MVNVLIVESPKKAKTIQKFLSADWRVMASAGHIRDLPEKEIGVEPPNFRPKYVISEGKKKTVDALKAAVGKASQVYLATDPDREGEAIAWHLQQVLKVQNPHRVTFNQVGQKAVLEALKRPRKVDLDLVKAQEARRVSDRLVGYLVSEALRNRSGENLTAGRVQSVALRLIVDLELQIRAFHARAYYQVQITLGNGLQLLLDVSKLAEDGSHLFDRQIADKALACQQVTIVSVETTPRERAPRSALTTSMLQQAANAALKLSAAEVMQVAQHLFESGLITYHRTDNPNLSEEGYEAAVAWLKANGYDYQRGQRRWKAKEGAQEAHEAIRPADFAVVEIDGTEAEKAVYRLIRERALMAQMPAEKVEVTVITAEGDQELLSEKGEGMTAVFKAKGIRQLDPGFKAFQATVSEDEEADPVLTVAVSADEKHSIQHAELLQKQTEPPKRYTEGTLVGKLESLGIGRPATYASILKNIITREYVVIGEPGAKSRKKDMRLFPTDTGFRVVEALRKQGFLDYKFTARLEDRLDKICERKDGFLEVVRDLHAALVRDLDAIEIERTGQGRGEFKTAPCPKCQATLKRIPSKKQQGEFFWAHVEETDTCDTFFRDQEGAPVAKAATQQAAAVSCPMCGQPLKRCQNRTTKGFFWMHVAEPATCSKYITDEEGKPVA